MKQKCIEIYKENKKVLLDHRISSWLNSKVTQDTTIIMTIQRTNNNKNNSKKMKMNFMI